MITEDITAGVVMILFVIYVLRRIIRGLRLLVQESRDFLGDMATFSREGRALRGELRKWRRRRRQIRSKEIEQ